MRNRFKTGLSIASFSLAFLEFTLKESMMKQALFHPGTREQGMFSTAFSVFPLT